MANSRNGVCLGEDDCTADLMLQATSYNNVELLESLLTLESHEEYINEQDSFGRTALHIAVNNNNLEIAYMLLQAGGQ